MTIMETKQEMPAGIKWMLIGSGLLTIGAPFCGILGTVLGMMRSFQVLGKSGVADMTGLSTSISTVLFSTCIGLFLGVIGLVIFLIVLFSWLSSQNQKGKPIPSVSPDFKR